MNLSFEQIVLNKLELSFLKTLLEADNWLHENYKPEKLDPERLIQFDFIEEQTFDTHAFYIITNLGESYLNFYKRAASRYKTELFFSGLAAVLSLISLAISAITLLLQV